MAGLTTTISGILIAVVAGLPGILAETLYSHITGRSWLEKDLQYYARVLGFSVAGLVGYGALSGTVSFLPFPVHILPETYSAENFVPAAIPMLSVGYIGHAAISAFAGIGFGAGLRTIRIYFPGVVNQEDAWDEFVKTYVANRWIVVRLDSGDAYAGMLQHADYGRKSDFRDIILAEPALFDENTQKYIATSNQFIYIRGDQWLFITALTKDDEINSRVTTIDRPLFEQGEDDEQERTRSQTKSETTT